MAWLFQIRYCRLNIDTDDLSPEARREIRNMRRALEADAPSASRATTVRASTRPVKPRDKPKEYRNVFVPVAPSDAAEYVGATCRVARRNGASQNCLLVGASNGALQFERRLGGGVFEFEYPVREIASLEVLQRQPY